MRRFILITGFVLASAAAQAGDRSLSLAGSDPTAVAAPAKAASGTKSAEALQAVETPTSDVPKYIERPAVVEPKAAAPKADTAKAASPQVEQPATESDKPAARKSASKSEKPRRKRYWTEARIIRELNRHGIYW